MTPHDGNHLTSPAWYALKEAIRARARGVCEWCRRRPMAILHHRTYVRVGQETPGDVMGVCNACHRTIHGLFPFGHTIMVSPESLAARGDSGKGDSEIWAAYLAAAAARDALP